MKRLAAILGFSILCLYMYSWAAEEPVSFSGTWILNSEKSDAAPRMIMPPGNSGVGDVSMGGGGFGGGMGGGGFGGGMGGGGFGGGMGGPGGGKGPQQQPPATVVIQQTESEIHITTPTKGMDGKEVPIIETYKLDGKELVEMVPIPNSEDKIKKTTKAKLKKNKFQSSVKNLFPPSKPTPGMPPMISQITTELKKDYLLSKDGKTLTLETANDMGMWRTIQKLVYNKQ